MAPKDYLQELSKRGEMVEMVELAPSLNCKKMQLRYKII